AVRGDRPAAGRPVGGGGPLAVGAGGRADGAAARGVGMSPTDDAAPEEPLDRLLETYDEALACGRPEQTPPTEPLPPASQERLERARACLRLLDEDRRAGAVSAPPPGAASAGPARL